MRGLSQELDDLMLAQPAGKVQTTGICSSGPSAIRTTLALLVPATETHRRTVDARCSGLTRMASPNFLDLADNPRPQLPPRSIAHSLPGSLG